MEQHGNIIREPRKGNWSVEETMILIEAKKMDEERRMKRSGGDTSGCSKPSEPRWKWIEEYCWKRGCLRNQNQCNDKWDNMMRDYKKVREYESRRGEVSDKESYWKLERHERRERNLPSNLLREIYEALVEVMVERRNSQRLGSSSSGGGGFMSYAMEGGGNSGQFSFLPPLHHQASQLPPPLQPPPPPPHFQSLPTLDSDTTDYPDSPAKRRKTGVGTASTSNEDVGSGITRSATTIAEAIQSCEEQEERRHREHLLLQERRLKMEEMKNEIDKQGISGLVYAINGLASSILDLASEKIPKS